MGPPNPPIASIFQKPQPPDQPLNQLCGPAILISVRGELWDGHDKRLSEAEGFHKGCQTGLEVLDTQQMPPSPVHQPESENDGKISEGKVPSDDGLLQLIRNRRPQ
mmetsp:Transcript_34369/g.85185  ORF Transcript_34369/g.85185 Transcript_34369/m.85185 type:complete len:106 (+) Transcript_34369:2368-2685(+)